MGAFGDGQESDAHTDLIGRRAELEVVERFVERAGGGLASLLVIGEAGIGKTSIWAAAARRAG